MSASAAPRKPLRVAIVGAGIIGLSIALELRSRGAEVSVYDRGLELGAGVTIRAAGMLGAAFEWAAEGEQRALAALARHAGMLWPDYVARLERLGGGMQVSGSVIDDDGALHAAQGFRGNLPISYHYIHFQCNVNIVL